MTRLYRATDDRRYTGQWSCWSESPEVAEAYTDNPGFGGATLLAADVEGDYTLDLAPDANPLRALAYGLYDDAEDALDAYEDWSARGYSYVYDVWENDQGVAEMLAAQYDWVRYEDDYPAGAITWTYLGREPVEAAEMERA